MHAKVELEGMLKKKQQPCEPPLNVQNRLVVNQNKISAKIKYNTNKNPLTSLNQLAKLPT